MSMVLLTGATGFIGSRLVPIIKEKNDVILLTSREIPGEKCVLHLNYSFSKEAFLKFSDYQIETVVHLGWYVPISGQEGVKAGLVEALYNTIHLLNNLPSRPKRIVYCSSVSVYGRFKDVRFHRSSDMDENSHVQPDDEYSQSKYIGELIVKDWCIRNDIECLILRVGPTYGPGDKRNSEFVGRIMQQALRNEEIRLFADPSMRRNLVFVDDLCRFIANAIDISNKAELINLVSDNNPSMIEIINSIVEQANSQSKVSIIKGDYFGRDFAFSSSKRKEYLGTERYTLDEGIKMTLKALKDRNG